jgi:hypothetical protein
VQADVGLAVERDTQKGKLGADVLAHPERVLADAASEDQRIDPSERDRHARHRLRYSSDVDREREARAFVVGGHRLELAHVRRAPRQPEQARFLFESVVELVDRQAVAQKVEKKAGVD